MSMLHVGEVVYEVHVNGSLLEEMSQAVSEEEGMAFEGTWMIMIYWDNLSTQQDHQVERSGDAHTNMPYRDQLCITILCLIAPNIIILSNPLCSNLLSKVNYFKPFTYIAGCV